MKKMLIVVALLAGFSVSAAEAPAEPPEPLQINSRESYSPHQFSLSDYEWRWLGQKRELKVGVWLAETPPFDMFTEAGKFEGIDADYTLLLTQYLGLRSQVLRYDSRDAALQALKNNQVDLVLDPNGNPLPSYSSLIGSDPFMEDRPTLIRRIDAPVSNINLDKRPLHLAVASNYLDSAWLNQHFPEAHIKRFNDDSAALASLAFGDSDFYLGNLTTASYLIGRNYNNLLAVQSIFPARAPGSRFLLRSEDQLLVNAVNKVIAAIPPSQNQVIYQQWSEGSDMLPAQQRLQLTEAEKRWLSAHRTIPVVVNSLYAPFTMFDHNGDFYGISADILRLIRLRTGLNFTPVQVDSVGDMFSAVKEGKGLFIGAISYSTLRDSSLRFSRPYFSSPFVLVVNRKTALPFTLSAKVRIAITANNQLIPELKQRYPGIQLLTVDNASLAMQMVNEGKADAAIHTLAGAGYMIDRYFRDDLKIATTMDESNPAQLAFAVRRDQPELYSILNKALADISPRSLTRVINKWQTTPDVRLDTWTVYRKQFWLLGAITAVIGLTSLVWIYYLRRQIAARRKAQFSLQSQLQFSDTLLNSVQVPVYVIDLNGGLVLFNDPWQQFFKLEMITQARGSIAQSDNPLHVIWQSMAGEVKSAHQQNFSLFNGESWRSVTHKAVPYVDDKQQVIGLICSWVDITEHQSLTSELSEARERAEQANRAKSTFLATMSHEIRTPVSAIIGLLELAVSAPGKKTDEDEPVRVAWESARSLMGIIGDILDMARIESGKLELAPEWVRTRELAPPVVRVFEGLARQKSLVLRYAEPNVMPYELHIDALRFRQILSNLVSNAIKFTEKGGVDVDINLLKQSPGEVILSVTVNDSGRGIEITEQRDIFNPWVQAQAGRKQSGSGLGLAICSQLVQMMGGNIFMESQPGNGTRVTFTLTVPARDYTPAAVSAPTDADDGDITSLRILAVDDHPANLMLLRRQLARLGHTISEACDGEQGWEMWQQQEFDLVITDCSMPGMDGLELTRLIRRHQQRPVMIVGLTANAWPEERARCQQAGMDDCMFKPLQLPQLKTMLRQVSRQLGETQIPTEERPMTLEQLVNFPALQQLTQNDDELLHELLQTTSATNQQDLVQAGDLVELEDWPELAKCIHRLSGAAQIISAFKVEALCRELESVCREENVDRQRVHQLWQQVQKDSQVLEAAMQRWLSQD